MSVSGARRMPGAAGRRGTLNSHRRCIGRYGYSDRISNPDPYQFAYFHLGGDFDHDLHSHLQPDTLAGADRNAGTHLYTDFDDVSNHDAKSLLHADSDGDFYANGPGSHRYAFASVSKSYQFGDRVTDSYAYARRRTHRDRYFNRRDNSRPGGVIAAATSAGNRGGDLQRSGGHSSERSVGGGHCLRSAGRVQSNPGSYRSS